MKNTNTQTVDSIDALKKTFDALCSDGLIAFEASLTTSGKYHVSCTTDGDIREAKVSKSAKPKASKKK